MFLRGHGYQDHSKENGSVRGVSSTRHQSGNLGEIQGDAARKWTIELRARSVIIGFTQASQIPTAIMWSPEGVSSSYKALNGSQPLEIYGRNKDAIYTDDVLNVNQQVLLDSSRIAPAANESRPANIAVKYVIKMK